MDTEEFNQRLAITLAGNTEFIKQAKDNYDGKMLWFCVSEQINATLLNVKIPVSEKD